MGTEDFMERSIAFSGQVLLAHCRDTGQRWKGRNGIKSSQPDEDVHVEACRDTDAHADFHRHLDALPYGYGHRHGNEHADFHRHLDAHRGYGHRHDSEHAKQDTDGYRATEADRYTGRVTTMKRGYLQWLSIIIIYSHT